MKNENYLADWLSGKISDGQLQQLVSAEDFLAFQQLKDTLDKTLLVQPETTGSFAAVKQKLANKKAVKGKVVPMWFYVAAACLLLSLGWYQLYFMSNQAQTSFGRLETIVLSDHSKVTLNAKSKLYHANLFSYNRTIELDGEAFFEVEKGSPFKVRTKLGEVTVLGTKFNVSSFSDYFEVVCHQGKVKVQSHGKTTLLTQGERVRFYGDVSENWADATSPKPLWISGETALKKVPMKYVFAQFENQFNVKVIYPTAIENITFTGSFTNGNKNTALQSICLPLGLKYKPGASGTIEISE